MEAGTLQSPGPHRGAAGQPRSVSAVPRGVDWGAVGTGRVFAPSCSLPRGFLPPDLEPSPVPWGQSLPFSGPQSLLNRGLAASSQASVLVSALSFGSHPW